jgi:hypothetical protein
MLLDAVLFAIVVIGAPLVLAILLMRRGPRLPLCPMCHGTGTRAGRAVEG